MLFCSIFALIALRKMTDYDDYCLSAVHGVRSEWVFRNMAGNLFYIEPRFLFWQRNSGLLTRKFELEGRGFESRCFPIIFLAKFLFKFNVCDRL